MSEKIYMNKTKAVKNNFENSIQTVKADICVIGSGISGLSASIEARRANKKVVLVDSNYHVGGQTFNSIIGCFCGFYSNGKEGYQFTHGIADEMFRDLKEAGGLYENPIKHTWVPYYNETLFLRWAEKLLLKEGVQVILGANLEEASFANRRIKDIQVSTKYGKIKIQADSFIDATGDAALAWVSGLTCNIPEKGGVYGSEMFLLENIDFSTPVPTEEELMERMKDKSEEFNLKREKGLMFYCQERGGIAIGNMTHVDTPLDPIEASLISMEGKDQVDNVIRFLKAEYPENFSDSNVRVYGATGVRQTRWINGVKQLTLEDVRAGTYFDDSIARSAWPVELHNYGQGYIWEMFDEDHVHYIPLGSLISPECDNYVACGRCIDADVAALSSVRVMGPCVATGAAAAHALILADGGSVHDIDIVKLQDRLYDNISKCD